MIDGTSVVKFDRPDRVAREGLVLEAVADIRPGSRGFEVPAVLSIEGGRLVTERIPGLVNFRTALIEASDPRRLAHRAGAAIARVHSQLEIPVSRIRCLPAPFGGPDTVPIHGDVSLLNIQFRADLDQVVVLDWDTPPWVNVQATHGSAFWDVSAFLVDLHYQRIREQMRIRDTAGVAGSFVAGYRSRRSLDGAALRRYLKMFVQLYLRERSFGLDTLSPVPDFMGMARLQRRPLMRFARSL